MWSTVQLNGVSRKGGQVLGVGGGRKQEQEGGPWRGLAGSPWAPFLTQTMFIAVSCLEHVRKIWFAPLAHILKEGSISFSFLTYSTDPRHGFWVGWAMGGAVGGGEGGTNREQVKFWSFSVQRPEKNLALKTSCQGSFVLLSLLGMNTAREHVGYNKY